MNWQILFGGAAAWFGRGTNILSGLVLMPVLFRRLPQAELGVWLLLAQSAAVLSIFDLGFGSILTRRIAFLSGNAPRGQPEARGAELSDLIATGRRVYGVLAFIACGVSFAAGSMYLLSARIPSDLVMAGWVAWLVLCLSQAFAMWSAMWTCVLQGLGYVGWDTILASLVNTLTLLSQILVVWIGGGVIGLAIATAGGAVLQRLLVIAFVQRRQPGAALRAGRCRLELIREMASPALRAWVTSLGYLLVANTDQFFITAQHGTRALPSYRAAFLLVINLHLLAGVFSAASPVFVSQLWQRGELGKIREILRRNGQVGLWAMACGAGAILALGPALFQFWLGPGNFAGYGILAVFLVTFILEHHANVFATCGRATNDEAYAMSSLATGVLKVALAWSLTRRFGLVGLAISTLLAQAAVNDWFMVFRSARRLGVNLRTHAREVLLPFAGLFLATLGVALIINQLLLGQRPGVRIAAVSATAMALWSASVWELALEPSQRARVLERFGVA